MPRIMRVGGRSSQGQQARQPQQTESFDAIMRGLYNEMSERELASSASPIGGETASTGVKNRGMHAEPHRLVNPVEHNVTANTQLALAA